MIKPSIGRVVLVKNRPGSIDLSQPERADICYVHSNNCINVAGNDANGEPFTITSLFLQQEDGDSGGVHAAWMPYQKAIAAGEPPVKHDQR